MKYIILLIFLAVPVLSFPMATFYDDFSDGDISDWSPRCEPASWTPSGGYVLGWTDDSPSILIPDASPELIDVVVETYAYGEHAFGVIARLNDDDCGVSAYISPDADVARIRHVENGELGNIYTSLSASFPSDTWYELTFTCLDDQLQFNISIPSTDQEWNLQATDPSPQTGLSGLFMGDEIGAKWDWFSITSSGSLELDWLSVDDDGSGESSGNGNMAFQAGEEIELNIRLRNDCAEGLTNVCAVLESLAPDIFVTDSQEDYPDIAPGAEVECLDDFGLTTQSGTPEGTVWPMKLTIVADGGFDAELYFDLPLGCGLTDDLEGSPMNWTFYSVETGWGTEWHLSNERNHTPGGSSSLKCGSEGSGDYGDMLYCVALSEPFNAPTNSKLDYWQWIDAELAAEPGMALDGGRVQVGQFDTWITLEPSGSYPYHIPEYSTGPFQPYTSVFSGTFGWTVKSMNIPWELYGPLQLRFIFGSDAAGNREGWHVDDISVQGTTGIEEGGPSAQEQVSLSAWPNPSLGLLTFTVAGLTGGGTLEVFDITGRVVSSIPFSDGGSASGVSWDWTWNDGRPLESGIYFARISGIPETSTRLVRLTR